MFIEIDLIKIMSEPENDFYYNLLYEIIRHYAPPSVLLARNIIYPVQNKGSTVLVKLSHPLIMSTPKTGTLDEGFCMLIIAEELYLGNAIIYTTFGRKILFAPNGYLTVIDVKHRKLFKYFPDPKTITEEEIDTEIQIMQTLYGSTRPLEKSLIFQGLGFFMPLLEGKNLRVIIIENNLSFEQKKAIALECITWVQYLHEMLNYFHGDIKPENFLCVLETLTLSLIDFGTAIKIKSQMQKEPICATEAYAAPEVLGNYALRRKEVTPYDGTKTDTYALGVTLAEIFCDHRVYLSLEKEKMKLKIITRYRQSYHPRYHTCKGYLNILLQNIHHPIIKDILENMTNENPAIRYSLQQIKYMMHGATNTTRGKRIPTYRDYPHYFKRARVKYENTSDEALTSSLSCQ